MPRLSTYSRVAYASRRILTDPIGFLEEIQARSAQGKLVENSVAELPYVQLCGSVKSGTSLLQSLFDGVAGFVTYPHESALTGEYYPKLRSSHPLEDKNFYHWLIEYYLAAVGRSLTKEGQKRSAVFTAPFIWRVRANMARALPTCSGFWDAHAAFLDSYLVEAGLKANGIWLDKSPFAHLFYPEIKEARPEAKFVHILRHPAGTLASIFPKYVRSDSSDSVLDALLWSVSRFTHYSFKAAEKNRRESDYYVIRYEDLCTNPRNELNRLCEFLEISPDLRMLDPTNGGHAFKGNNWEGVEFDKISAHSVNRWRRKLPPYFINATCYPTIEFMNGFDYSSPASLTTMEADFSEHLANTRTIPSDEMRGKYHPEICPNTFDAG